MVGGLNTKLHLKQSLYRAVHGAGLSAEGRLRRRTFDSLSLEQFRKTNACTSILCRPAESVEIRGPQFLGDYISGPNTQEKVTVRAPPLEIVEFSDVAVMGGTNLVLHGRQAIFPDIIQPDRDMLLAEVEGLAQFVREKNRLYLLGPPIRPNSRRKTIRVNAAISLLGECSANYAHWLIEILPKLIAADEHEQYSSLPILVDGWVHPNLSQSLILLNRHHRPVLPVERWQTVAVDRLLYVTPPAYSPPENRSFYLTGKAPEPSPDYFLFSQRDLAALRSKAVTAARKYLATGSVFRPLPTIARVESREDTIIAAFEDNSHPTGTTLGRSTRVKYSDMKRIYLRRVAASAGNPRHLLDGNRIESILADFGFAAVDPAKLSFPEQVLLLQNAECVVAPVGAALANLIFAPPGCKVIALGPHYRDADCYYFSNLLGVLGHKLYYVLGPQVYQPNVHRLHRDYMIDGLSLKEALHHICD
jgi:hypothetical protein